MSDEIKNIIKDVVVKNFGKILLALTIVFFLIFSHVTGLKGISVEINLNMNFESKENPPTQQYHNVRPKKLQKFS